MAWSVKQLKGKFCVIEDGGPIPIENGCHDNQEDADKHVEGLEGKAKLSLLEPEIVLSPPSMAQIAKSFKDLSDLINQELFVPETEAAMIAGGEGVEEFKWEGPIAFEGVFTGDKRFFHPGAIEWNDDSFPVPFRWQKASTQGHAGAVPIGRVDSLERREDGMIYAYGVVIPSLNEEAAEYLRMLESGVAGGVSVDGDSAVFDTKELADGSTSVEFTCMRIRSLTACDVPAFSDAQVDLTEEKDEEEEAVLDLKWEYNITAAACAPLKPPIDWFADPMHKEGTPVTVTKEGQVFGHLALFNSCHIGYPGSCVSPPKGSSYKYFHTGEVETETGDLVEVGHLTFNTGHAAIHDNAKAAATHYDHTGAVAADVRVGEDKHGIWVAGALRSHLSDEDVRTFRAAPLSGDWRRIAGRLELVAALAVNVPGFPVPRTRTLVASGETEALITFQEAEQLPSDYEERLSRMTDYRNSLCLEKKTALAKRVGLAQIEEGVG